MSFFHRGRITRDRIWETVLSFRKICIYRLCFYIVHIDIKLPGFSVGLLGIQKAEVFTIHGKDKIAIPVLAGQVMLEYTAFFAGMKRSHIFYLDVFAGQEFGIAVFWGSNVRAGC